jgi:hypothetical protein
MKTKIGLPLGLALVMFIGVFTTMLALGALNPRPAEAQATITTSAADLMVVRSNDTVDAIADWTITAMNDTIAILVEGTIVLDLTDHTLGATCDATQDAHAVCNESQWEIDVAATETADAISVDVDSVATSDTEATITVGTEIPANRMFTITFTPYKDAGGDPTQGITNPGTAAVDTIITVAGQDFTIVTFAVGATIADDPAPTVERSDNRVGAYATWTITATTDDTTPIVEGGTIVIVFTDQDVGADCAADAETTAVCTEANWAIGPDPDTTADNDIATVESVSVDADTKTVRIVTATLAIAVNTEFTITFTPPPPPRWAYGIRPPR